MQPNTPRNQSLQPPASDRSSQLVTAAAIKTQTALQRQLTVIGGNNTRIASVLTTDNKKDNERQQHNGDIRALSEGLSEMTAVVDHENDGDSQHSDNDDEQSELVSEFTTTDDTATESQFTDGDDNRSENDSELTTGYGNEVRHETDNDDQNEIVLGDDDDSLEETDNSSDR